VLCKPLPRHGDLSVFKKAVRHLEFLTIVNFNYRLPTLPNFVAINQTVAEKMMIDYVF